MSAQSVWFSECDVQTLERPNSQVHPRPTESETLEAGLQFCISNKFSGDASSPGATF